jgi:hypothetical protein
MYILSQRKINIIIIIIIIITEKPGVFLLEFCIRKMHDFGYFEVYHSDSTDSMTEMT